ncbi:MAG: helix-turn-helix domain-containing protein [Pseudonocardiaceae bacterium]|nr:helix-turn-helix domain-containing protein [Pseudonocardiaceae bacterium]
MAGSSAPLRRLGAELRRLREATGRTQGDIGAAIGRTHTTLVNWERGKTKISKSDLVCLLAELRAPVDVRKGLEQLRDESGRGAGQWVIYGLPDRFRPFVSFEEDAVAETSFQPVIIDGLLQTEEYARATHVAAHHVVAASAVDNRVAARMQRQQRLTGPDPLRLHAVICEAALRLEVGTPGVMTAQLERLLDAASADNVTIQVLPATQGHHAGIASNFTVLHFADPTADPPLGYFDGPLGGYMISDEGDVASMVNMFDDLRQPALDATHSAELLAAILEEYRRKGGDHA